MFPVAIWAPPAEATPRHSATISRTNQRFMDSSSRNVFVDRQPPQTNGVRRRQESVPKFHEAEHQYSDEVSVLRHPDAVFWTKGSTVEPGADTCTVFFIRADRTLAQVDGPVASCLGRTTEADQHIAKVVESLMI